MRSHVLNCEITIIIPFKFCFCADSTFCYFVALLFTAKYTTNTETKPGMVLLALEFSMRMMIQPLKRVNQCHVLYWKFSFLSDFHRFNQTYITHIENVFESLVTFDCFIYEDHTLHAQNILFIGLLCIIFSYYVNQWRIFFKSCSSFLFLLLFFNPVNFSLFVLFLMQNSHHLDKLDKFIVNCKKLPNKNWYCNILLHFSLFLYSFLSSPCFFFVVAI